MQLEPDGRQILDCSVGVMSVAITRNIWRPRDESLPRVTPGLMRGGPGLMSDCYEYYFLLSAVRASEIISSASARILII